jgi:hypothetical protein
MVSEWATYSEITCDAPRGCRFATKPGHKESRTVNMAREAPLFCRYANKPGHKETRLVCTAKMAREALKAGVLRAGICPDRFSFHSLRKGGLTHMGAKGVPKDQALDRSNYSATSRIMNTTYDYNASGLGPLASNSLAGGSRSGLEELRRWLPARHESEEK